MEICRGKRRIKLNEKVTAIDFDESNRPFRSICINKSTAVSQNIQRSIDAVNRGIFARLSNGSAICREIYIYIGTKQGLVGYITFHSNLDGNHDFAKYH